MSAAGLPRRLPNGGVIDRSHALKFRFDGVEYQGFAGDTLASALLGSGVRLVGRSFKYHRPRGIFGAGVEEPNALVELREGARREPNTRVTVVELWDGLTATSQNRWPSLALDFGAVNSLVSPLLVAGFYYKTFMWPQRAWEKLYEPLIRRAAGLGRASSEADCDRYEQSHAFCDVLIIGGGPAGLAAALSAGRAGARVILCDEDFVLGGRLLGERQEVDGMPGRDWAQRVAAELATLPEVQILRRSTVFGVYDGGLSGARVFGAIERVSDHLAVPAPNQPRQRYWKIVAKRTVLAAGAFERPIVFGGNDRPGVMLASAVRTYLNRFGVSPGSRVAIFTSADDGWRTAFDLASDGVELAAVIDTRMAVAPALLERASRACMQVYQGASVVDTDGGRALKSVTIRDCKGRLKSLDVDTLAVSGGWNPNLALATHVGNRPRWSEEVSAFVPAEVPRGIVVVGAARGSFTLARALEEGATAGIAAAEATGHRVTKQAIPRADDEAAGVTPLWFVAESRSKAFVDLQHDVTQADIALGVREGFRSAELLKRYTTLGMATDQGKSGGVTGHAIMAALTGQGIQETGTTIFRPPYTPVAIGALAGMHRGKEFKPTRYTSAHEWAREQGATFVKPVLWLRPQWFSRPGEKSWLETVSREVRAVRSSVGLCDVSTLGKIDVQGSDAAAFLDSVYINAFSSLPVGKTRYGVMLREDGFVMDDGTSARLAPDHFVMSTTTANALKVMQHLEHARQVLWPELDVQLTSITDQWVQYAIAGPNARELLQRVLGAAVDVSNAAFPYMGCAEFEWRGMRARLFRISFSGELAYELAVPAKRGDAVVRALMAAGESLGVTPYGTEALGVLRIEKGHVAGNELNGTTTASDLGLGRMMSTKKDYIGRVLAGRPALVAPDRPVLVGVQPVDKSQRLQAGAHFVSLGAQPTLENDQGYLTSAAFSPMLGHWIGLGLLQHGARRMNEHVRAYDPIRGRDFEVKVVSPVFFDPTGARLGHV